jgi:hypothetical protein
MADEQTILAGAQDDTVNAEQNTEQNQTSPAQDEGKQPDSLIAGAGTEEKPADDTKKDDETEGKQEEKAEDKKGDEGKKTEPKAPAEYADFTFPEGVEADSETLTEFKAIAKELDLTQEQAQKLVDLQVKMVQADAKAQVEALEALGNEWAEQTKKELGKNLNTELAFVAKARNQFASKELIQLLDETKLGNHPEMVKLFAAIGKAISEDIPLGGKNAPKKDPLAIMYPSMATK